MRPPGDGDANGGMVEKRWIPRGSRPQGTVVIPTYQEGEFNPHGK